MTLSLEACVRRVTYLEVFQLSRVLEDSLSRNIKDVKR